MQTAYATSLDWALKRSPLMLVITALTIATTIALYIWVPKGFFPQQDTGRLSGTLLADQDISFQALKQKLAAVVDIIQSDPAVDNVIAFIGGGGGGAAATQNSGRMFIALKPLAQRKVSADQVIARLRKRLSQVPGAPTYLQAVQDLRVGGFASAAQYQYVVQGEDLNALNAFAPKMERALRGVHSVTDVNSDLQTHGLQTLVALDRSTASRFGITPQLVDDTLYDAFGQRQVSTLYTTLNQYHVVMEVAPRYWQSPESLSSIWVQAPDGGVEVPLNAVTRSAPSGMPLSVNHRAQAPAVTLSFNLAPGVALGEAVSQVDAAAAKAGVPSGLRTSFSGTAEAFQSSLASEPLLVLAALLAVYVVLGVLYESFVHPLTILSTLPSAGVGALLALLVTHADLNVIALIGIVLLIGIVKKNGIMLVDFALDAERREQRASMDAIREACRLRFRPIMMTTLAALLGALPLALGHGEGSEVRRPLGIAIVGGLLVSQVLTLYTTPVIYLYLDRFRVALARWRAHPSTKET